MADVCGTAARIVRRGKTGVGVLLRVIEIEEPTYVSALHENGVNADIRAPVERRAGIVADRHRERAIAERLVAQD